jgi:hypothetical protein
MGCAFWEQEKFEMSAMTMVDMALATDPSLPEYFLGQLASMATRQAASPSPKEQAALSVAMFSVFLDCIDLGVGTEAQQIMSQLRNQAEALEPVAA